VTLRGGSHLQGRLLEPAADREHGAAPTDFTKARFLTLDLSLEYPGLNGTVTVSKSEVLGLQKLKPFDPKELEARRTSAEAIERARKKEEQAAAEEPSPPPVPTAEAPAPSKKAHAPKSPTVLAKDLIAGLELYLKYPPSDGWGPEREQGIRLKLYRSQLPTLPEREFHEGFPLWMQARQLLDQWMSDGAK